VTIPAGGVAESGSAFSFSPYYYEHLRMNVPVEVTIHEITWDEKGALASFSADVVPQPPKGSWSQDVELFTARLRWRVAPDAPPENKPPQVHAGEDVMLTTGNRVKLIGWMNDDLQPFGNNLSAKWEQISGPPLKFRNAGYPGEVEFRSPGIYRLRLTVSDGVLSASDDVKITVGQPYVGKYDGLVTVDGRPVGSIALKFTPAGMVTGVLQVGDYRLPLRENDATISRELDLGGTSGYFEMFPSHDRTSVIGYFQNGEVRAIFTATQSAQGLFATGQGSHAQSRCIHIFTPRAGRRFARGARLWIAKNHRIWRSASARHTHGRHVLLDGSEPWDRQQNRRCSSIRRRKVDHRSRACAAGWQALW
jgi:hypothetical protein